MVTTTASGWRHLAFTGACPERQRRDGTTSTNGVKIYVNGAPDTQGQGTATATETAAGTLNLWIGDLENNRGHVGSLDEVHIYGTALSATQVQKLYGASASRFVYDGDGNRIKKLENGVSTVYINRYYEKNLTASEETKHYFLGAKEVAFKKGTNLYYLLTDHLGSTSVITDSAGNHMDAATYYPFGSRRASDVTLTDKLFTGQEADQTGLDFFEARYYDTSLGRFISSDSVVPGATNPQAFNRYAYTVNNPLKYIDPTGHHHRPDEEAALGSGVMSGQDALDLEAAVDWEHEQESKFGGELTLEKGEAPLNSLSEGSVLLVTDERTSIQVINPQADVVFTNMFFPDVGAVDVTVRHGPVPPGAAAITTSQHNINYKGSPVDMSVRLLVHESEHVQQRTQYGDALFNFLYGSGLPFRDVGWDDTFENAAYATSRASYWVLKPTANSKMHAPTVIKIR